MKNRFFDFSMNAGIAAVAIAGLGAPALADDAGKNEYLDACAACHGVDGAGSGPVADYMSVVVPPLTELAAANDGTFPMSEVVAIIDGRTDVRAHGSGMPVWGAVFADPLAAEVKGESVDYVVRGRILSLALYLESIQK